MNRLFPGFLYLIVTFLSVVDVLGQPVAKLASYVQNKDVSKNAKDFYSGKFQAGDDERTFSIFDSLNTKNNFTRPFYIYLVSKIIKTSDGALTEGAVDYCQGFLEKQPDALIAFLYSGMHVEDWKVYYDWVWIIHSAFELLDCNSSGRQFTDAQNFQKCLEESRRNTLGVCDGKHADWINLLYDEIRVYPREGWQRKYGKRVK